MGGNVGGDDGTSKTPLVSTPALPALLALPALTCPTRSTVPYSVLSCFVCLLVFQCISNNI